MTESFPCNVCYLLSESRGGNKEPHPIHPHLNTSLHTDDCSFARDELLGTAPQSITQRCGTVQFSPERDFKINK